MVLNPASMHLVCWRSRYGRAECSDPSDPVMIGPLKVTAIPKLSPIIYICKYRRNPIWCHSDLFTVNNAHIIRSFDGKRETAR
ncbi:predicted protein [Sclerotinia sclerotiorum 1980 UF-70]|uniref:Uncharacterized protein n=1 Tax=Sclerotinia sclerotiorum (strain ATCC 18683 / 1980 / Ss-1) TaxID=665079 RepID=A7ENV8_SCLS1|nr:predicted protein [Sclerotinia sclerotiorum 1980 UF-70]EDO04524.1 predicted protein [Sclerotinia sclerotiorum 1980 UF-70]